MLSLPAVKHAPNTNTDSLMSCPCGNGYYLYCYTCPYSICSAHGDDVTPEWAEAMTWWREYLKLAYNLK